jgi:hypothetical protein
MPRAKGRASQTLIDRIHAKTARAIDATFNQHSKEKTVPPATFLAQAIKFLQTTDSTAPERVRKKEPATNAAQQRAEDAAFRLEMERDKEIERLYAHGREPTPAELDAFNLKFPAQGSPADVETDFTPDRAG